MQAVTEQDIAYEDIMQEPVQQLQLLAQSLGIADKVPAVVPFTRPGCTILFMLSYYDLQAAVWGCMQH